MIWGVVGGVELKHDWSWVDNCCRWVPSTHRIIILFCLLLHMFGIFHNKRLFFESPLWIGRADYSPPLCIPTTILTFPEANECSETTHRIVLEKRNWRISKNIIPILEDLFLVENVKFRLTRVEFEIPSCSSSWNSGHPPGRHSRADAVADIASRKSVGRWRMGGSVG